MKNAIKMMENNMSEDSVRRARMKAELESLSIRMSELREERDVKQSEMKNFRQSSVSKIESRKDMKISTILDYFDSLGMGVEISVFPRSGDTDSKQVLLRV
ncbi:MAG: XRE family transcriptional regulator [Spirochaetales bacterium]